MRRHWLAYALTGAFLYVVFLVAGAPAALMAKALAQATKGAVMLTGAHGSIWSGQGELIVHRAPNAPLSMGHGKWHVKPFWLALGRAKSVLDLTGPALSAHAIVDVNFRSIQLSDLDIRFPVALIEKLYVPASLVRPTGDVRVTAPAIDVAGGVILGTAEVRWVNAASALSSVKPLGDFRLQLRGESKETVLKLETLRGDLWLNGDGQYKNHEQQLSLSFSIKPLARADELEPLLMLFGANQGQGERRVSINMPLRVF